MKVNSQDVLWLASWWPSKDNPTFGIFIKEHALAITKTGVNLLIINVSIRKSSKILGVYKTDIYQEEDNGIKLFRAVITTRVRRFGVHDYLIKRAYKKLYSIATEKQKPLFLHLHVRDHNSKLAFELNCFRSLPLIHTEHFSFYHRGILELDSEKQAIETNELKKWFKHPNLKVFSPVSNELGSVVVNKFGLDQRKMKVIGNVSNDHFRYDDSKKIEKKICLIASWHKPKNPLLFFKALNAIDDKYSKNFRVIVFGDGPLLEECFSFVRERLGHLNIEFKGFKSKDIIANELRTASFLVHPSDKENLPTSIIESLCSGVPVISMNINGIPELIDQSNGILVPPKNLDALSKALVKMIDSYHLYDRQKVSETALSRFSAESIASQTINLYKSLE